MKSLKEYDISFVGLKIGNHNFDYQVDEKLFENYQYDEFNNVKADVALLLRKNANSLELDLQAKGTVNVQCDLSCEPYDQIFEGKFHLIVQFGETFNDDHDEILILPASEHTINIAQYIYELIVLSVPAKRIHPGIADGTLKSDLLDLIRELNPEYHTKKENEIDPRWDNLKKIYNKK